MTHRHERSLNVAALPRVEGEGAMHVQVEDGRVLGVRLEIYEPPRFFEAMLPGRAYTEPPDITARICGICPVAYQLTAAQAIEQAIGVRVTGALADLRRLLYCGEWISSHTLHVYLLHAPDFLGYPDAVELARDRRDLVERGLALKKAGNELMTVIGGRAIHPVNLRVGGFYRMPEPAELRALVPSLRRALDLALDTVTWVAGFEFPDFTCRHELLALVQPGRYAIESGTPVTDRGLTFATADFGTAIVERQVPHSTALHAELAGRGRYLTGPMARFALSRSWLSPLARQAADAAGLTGPAAGLTGPGVVPAGPGVVPAGPGVVPAGTTPPEPPWRNPFRCIVIRAVETVYAVQEALRLIDEYQSVPVPALACSPRAGIGAAATEAPRGVLFHRYEVGADGLVRSARIVPPTAQNQAAIEEDLCRYVQDRLHLSDERLTSECESAIRNYDPCISCATHFLTLTVEGRP